MADESVDTRIALLLRAVAEVTEDKAPDGEWRRRWNRVRQEFPKASEAIYTLMLAEMQRLEAKLRAK